MNLNKVLFPILLFASFVFAQGFFVETLDEQKSSNNLLVLRFRVINNTPVTIRDASLRYCLTKSPDKVVEVDNYYIGNSHVSLENIDSTNACLNIKMDSIPYGVFPNQSGYSVGVHYSDWSSRNKTLDFSNPQSSTFTRADNVALYVDETILYGSDYQVANDSNAYLPEATPVSVFDGVTIALAPNEPCRLAWNFVDDAEKYLLTVLREDSTLVHSAEYVTNVADVSLPVGRYLWNVQAVNSEKPARSLFRRFFRIAITAFRYGNGYRVGGTDTITSTDGRKDTRLLNISWGELADQRKWDTIHAPLDPITRPYDEDEGSRCWAIAIQNLNHHYRMADGEKGNLTLDEIVALGHMYEHAASFYDTATTSFPLKYEDWREKVNRGRSPAAAAFPLNRGGPLNAESYMLGWALNIPRPKLYKTNEEFQGRQDLITKMWIDSLSDGKPIYVAQCNFKSDFCDELDPGTGTHAMIIDGFQYVGDSVYFHFINTDNYGTHEWRVFEVGDWRVWQFIYSFFIISNVDTVRATLPEVHVDSDSDGVMDFDELYRFESDYRLADTDHDGVDDKTEIHSYVIREKVKTIVNNTRYTILLNDSLQRFPWRAVYSQETLVDIDKDGRRVENDDDSDGDGVKDGEEDLNHNGIVDSGETDPYYNDNVILAENEIPNDIVIYASDFVRINDGVKLYENTDKVHKPCREPCGVVAESNEGLSVVVGAKARVGNIYSKGQVWVRNQGSVGIVRYYGLPQEFTTVLQSVSSLNEFYTGLTDFNLYEYQWPYHIPEFTAKVVNSNAEKIVRAGECDTLKGAVSFKTIKVEAGGKLYFDEGEITVNNLQLDARATIDFVKPGFSTILHVNEKIQWNASTENEDKSSVAKGFKLYYYGSDRFFVHGAWAGTIIAPNAQLVLGQTHNKELYGQFYGKSIIVHQYSKVYRIPFNPQKSAPSALLDVAWIGGQK